MLLIDAVYIHESGGKTLLNYFMKELVKRYQSFVILFDERIDSEMYQDFLPAQYIICKPSEKSRLKIYREISNRIKTIFCFANVPPPVNVNGAEVFILFHNVLIVSGFSEKNNYSIYSKFLFYLKRIYILFKKRREYKWVVQTELMKLRITNSLRLKSESVFVLPFYEEKIIQQKKSANNPPIFIYIADGVPQKNHEILLDAWGIVYNKYQLKPTLYLTVPNKYVEIHKRMNKLVQQGLDIRNKSFLGKKELNNLYRLGDYLIFPSLAESFGLPLIEAVQEGCGVLASDLPFVFEVLNSSIIFNPYSSNDVAKGVHTACSNVNSITPEIKIKNNIRLLINTLTN